MKKNMKKILLLSALTISALSFGACKNVNTDITDISTETETERVVETKEEMGYTTGQFESEDRHIKVGVFKNIMQEENEQGGHDMTFTDEYGSDFTVHTASYTTLPDSFSTNQKYVIYYRTEIPMESEASPASIDDEKQTIIFEIQPVADEDMALLNSENIEEEKNTEETLPSDEDNTANLLFDADDIR